MFIATSFIKDCDDHLNPPDEPRRLRIAWIFGVRRSRTRQPAAIYGAARAAIRSFTTSAIFCAAPKSNVLIATKAPTPRVGANAM
jgi:hypothetical protein